MVRIGNLLFHYRNAVFPIAATALLLPSPRVIPSDAIAVLLGACVLLAGQMLRVLTIGLAYIKRGGRDRCVYAEHLVMDGIFAHCRNPMYIGNVLMVLGFGLALNSLICFAVGGALAVFAYHAIILAEEDFLRRKFAVQYDRYCATVPRWRIRLAGLRGTMRAMRFDWRRVIVREYGTLFNSLAGLPLALCLRRYLFGWGKPDWTAVTPICLVWAAAMAVLYLAARYLKKARRLQPARP